MFQRTPYRASVLACSVAILSLHVDSASARLLSSEPNQHDGWFSRSGDPWIIAKSVSRPDPRPSVTGGASGPDHRYVAFISPALPTDCEGVASLERRFVDDLKSKNLDDMLAAYASGAVFIQPDGTEVAGRDALRKLYLTIFATYNSDLSLEDSEPPHPVSAGSSLCVHSGNYRENLQTRKDRTIAHVQGTYSFTYKRMKSGAWLFTRMRWTNGT